MKLIGAMRVKNEARWIARVIESLLPLCSDVLVMDDNSTDDTANIARRAGAHVIESPFNPDAFNETRDKNFLLREIAIYGEFDWCLMIDGDEMLAPGCDRLIASAITSQQADAYRFRIRYLWDRENQIRTDRWYDTFSRPSLWKLAPEQRFESHYRTGLHCGNTPANVICAPEPIGDLLHFGYLHREDRIRKYEYYNQLDPGNEFEDHYRHMVIGDLPELPATYVGKWAGPLKLEAL